MSKTGNLVQIVEVQDQIIRIQSEAITELFQLLAQHISADEIDSLPCVERINSAAALQSQIE